MSDEGGGPARGPAIAGLAVIAILVLTGLWLSGILGHAGSVQDCVAAGRSNCAPVATETRH